MWQVDGSIARLQVLIVDAADLFKVCFDRLVQLFRQHGYPVFSALAERWVAVTSEYGTLGQIWEDGVLENEISTGAEVIFLRPKQTLAPHTWTPAGTLFLYVGPGDWRTVRGYARRLAGTESAREPIPAQRREVCEARFEPAPLVTLDDGVTAQLVVDNLRARPITGSAELSTPAGLSAGQTAFELSEVNRDKPFEACNPEVHPDCTGARMDCRERADRGTRRRDPGSRPSGAS